jgi:hypothetical protein
MKKICSFTFYSLFTISITPPTSPPPQKIRERDTIGDDLQKVSVRVSAPNPLKLCIRIQLRVDSLSRLFPAFLCFEYRL